MPSTRRDFLRSLAGMTGGLVALPLADGWPRGTAVGRQRTLKVGHVLPATAGARDVSSALGVRFGFEEAQHAARLFGVSVELASGDKAERLVSQSRPHVLIGGSSEETCASLSQLSDAEEILFFNVACTSDAMRSAGCRRNTFHIAASDAMRRDALAQAKTSGDAEVLLWH